MPQQKRHTSSNAKHAHEQNHIKNSAVVQRTTDDGTSRPRHILNRTQNRSRNTGECLLLTMDVWGQSKNALVIG